MTDNRTTELRKLLDERGIEWKDGDAAYDIEWSTPDGRHCSAMYWKPTFTVLISGCTPEQAIAATLGSGTLTAEQVREAVKRGATFDYGEIGEYVSLENWQAIADELNATLGDDCYRKAAEYWKGMYEELLTERIGEERDYPEHDGRYECPDCGNVVYYDELHGGGWTIYVEDYQIPFNACPNCGKRCVRHG